MPKKAEKTKTKLYEAALKLFELKGFDGTTMRDIAQEAEVALGAIYYHFPSKEAFIAAYYDQSYRDHDEALGDYLKVETDFAARLHRVVKSKIEVAEPQKDLARALFRVAANPDSQLSPWSEESKELRLESVAMFREVIEGSTEKFHSDVKPLLAEYLWLYQMGLILFWIYDSSQGSKKTFALIDRSVPMIVKLNKMLRSSLASPIRKQILKVMTEFHPNLGQNKPS